VTQPTTAAVDVYSAAEASAAALGDLPHRTIRMAGRAIRLRFAGDLEPRLIGPFQHLVTEDDPAPDLTVTFWDSAGTGAPELPRPAPRPGDPEGARWDHHDGPRSARYWPASGLWAAYDASVGDAWWWVPAVEMIPWHEFAAPMRSIVNWWGTTHDLTMLHAGAVGGEDGRGVILGGRGGSGKSTTSLACLADGMRFASDDYVLLEVDDRVRAHSVYGTAKLEERGAPLVGHVSGRRLATATEGAKLVVDVARDFAPLVTPELEIVAAVLPRVTTAGPALVPLDRPTALRALAPSTVLQAQAVGAPRALRAMSGLLERVPAHQLDTGPDPLALPAVLRELIADG
jgi:hypothetical protein